MTPGVRCAVTDVGVPPELLARWSKGLDMAKEVESGKPCCAELCCATAVEVCTTMPAAFVMGRQDPPNRSCKSFRTWNAGMMSVEPVSVLDATMWPIISPLVASKTHEPESPSLASLLLLSRIAVHNS